MLASNIDWIAFAGNIVASNGKWFLDLNGTQQGGIQQTFDTVPGSTYVVTFDLNANYSDGVPLTPKSLAVLLDNVQLGVFTYVPTVPYGPWQPETVSFNAVNVQSTLSFQSLVPNSAYGPFLDNVTVSTGCQVKPADISIFPGGPYSIDRQPITMYATFVPTDTDGLPVGLTDEEAACGFTGFNWQQIITYQSALEEIKPKNPLTAIGNGIQLTNLSADGSLQAPPAYSDPPLGGYGYEDFFDDAYPFYWSSTELEPASKDYCNAMPIKTPSTLLFSDCPGTVIEKDFTTTLVGVLPSGMASAPIFTWKWYTTFNGTDTGGVKQNKSTSPPSPNSGTGGVTITNINGVQLPTAVSASQVTTTASGLAYSRVSQTFNGTVTIKNMSASAISGPLQIVFFGMPANVTLANATSNLSGTPYLTVPEVTGLAPGQSVTVSIQLKNPSNTTLNLTPVIYSGSI